MQIISEISDLIECKLTSAEDNIKAAMEYKEDNPDLAAILHRISVEEMNQINMLHDQVANIITDYRKKNGDPPEKMLGIYEYLHKKHIEKASRIKVLQSLFK